MEGWVNAGFFIFNPGVFDYLDGDDCVLEQKPLERLCADGELMAYQHDGFFFAMDTYREYLYLNSLWDSGEAPWRVWP
jgi:glucose-1-phosphate cytidylyltransferase